MTRTLALLHATLGRDLGRLTYDYFRPVSNDPYIIGRAGAFEQIIDHPHHAPSFRMFIFDGVCAMGYTALMHAMIHRGVCLRSGIHGAARGNQLEIVLYLDAMQPDVYVNWNDVLLIGCANGHRAIVDLAIERGGTSWNWGMAAACEHGHLELIQLMIGHGADHWNWGFQFACRTNQLAAMRVMAERGAVSCAVCRRPVAEHPGCGPQPAKR